MRVSILVMAFLPPFRALVWASSTLACMSLVWASSSLFSLSRAWAISCSALSSSARRAASIMALWAFSSDREASPAISSQSACRVDISDSSFILVPWMAWLVQVVSDRFSLVSASSCSTMRRERSACSSRVLASSRAFWLELALRSALISSSWATSFDLCWSSGCRRWQRWLAPGCSPGRARRSPASSSSSEPQPWPWTRSPRRTACSRWPWSCSSWWRGTPRPSRPPPVDLLPHLGELQLAPEHLVLLLLQGALGLGQSGLKLHLLSLHPLADFVNLVDRATSLADLVHDVLDLVAQGLVLPPHLVQLQDGLLVGGLDAEQHGGGVAGLLLSVVQVHADAVDLLLPLANNPVELLGLLLHGAVEDLGLVQLGGHGVEVALELGLVLLHLAQLGVQLVGGGLCLRQAGLHLQLGHLQLLGLGHSLLLVPHLHHLGLSIGLALLPDHVLLGADLLVVVVPHAGHLVLGVPVFPQQALPLLGLVVSHGAGLAELVGQGDLQLGQHVGGVLQLLQLAEQVTVLSGQLPLVSLHVSQGQVGLLHLLAEVVQAGLEVLDILLRGSLAAVDLVSGSAGISDLVHDDGLVLLNLGLDLVQLLHLLLHLSGGVSVLLLQADNGGLLLDLGLLQVPPQLAHLGLPLLVELNLSAGGPAGLSQPLAQVLQLPGQVGPLSLGLGSALSLSLQLLLHLLDPGLDLLDGLLDLGHQGLLVLQLAHQGAAVLLLALDGGLQLLPGPLQLGDGLLHDPQLALDLPPLLLDVGAAALLLLVGSLQLVQSGLQLALDLVEVTNLVLGHLQVLGGLGSVLADVLLLLVQLVDHLVLVGDLVVQRLDGVVSVGLLLLQLLDGNHDVVNVLFDDDDLLLQDLLVLHCVLASGLSLGQFLLGVSQVGLQAGHLGGALGLLLVVDGQVALLLLQLSQQGLLLLLDGLVLLQQPLLGLHLLLVLPVHLVGLLLQQPQLLLGVGHSDQGTGLLDDDEPAPLPHGHVLPEVPLGHLDQLPLVPLLFVDSGPDPLKDLSLDHPHPLEHELITSLLQSSQSSGSEEDESVAQPVPLSGELDLVHQSVGGGLVVAGAGDLLLTQTGVSHLVVGVEHPVGETSHADPDTLQHTVTGQLVHDQGGLHLAGLLVGVGHQATDKVRLAGVEGGHQLSQGDQVDGAPP